MYQRACGIYLYDRGGGDGWGGVDEGRGDGVCVSGS